MLVGDLAVAADNERFGDTIDAPLDRGTPTSIHPNRSKRISVASQEAPCILRFVLIIDPDQTQPRIGGNTHELRVLRMAWYAPRSPHIDQRHLPLKTRRIKAGHLRVIAR